MSVSGVGAAALAAAAMAAVLWLGTAQRACAQSDADADGRDAVERRLLFSGGDLWRQGGFLHAGFVWSPDGLAAEGLALKAMAGAGRYRYRSGDAEVVGTLFAASAQAGWRFKRESVEATLYAGVDAQAHRLAPDDPGARLRGAHVGARFSAEIWLEPTPQSMLQGWATWSSVDGGYAARAAAGWRLLNQLYCGPEAQAFGDGAYRQVRIGVHLTAWRAGGLEWSAGAGFLADQAGDRGGYLRIGLLARR